MKETKDPRFSGANDSTDAKVINQNPFETTLNDNENANRLATPEFNNQYNSVHRNIGLGQNSARVSSYDATANLARKGGKVSFATRTKVNLF